LTWSYDNTALGTGTEAERVNSVRLLLGDTDINDQQVQDEEVVFALSQNSDNIYSTGSWLAYTLASKYSRYVDIEIDGQVEEKYSQLYDQYTRLASSLSAQSKSLSAGLYIYAGGIRTTQIEIAQEDTSRVQPEFKTGQFKNPPTTYATDDE
jgi:hypothetical protein